MIKLNGIAPISRMLLTIIVFPLCCALLVQASEKDSPGRATLVSNTPAPQKPDPAQSTADLIRDLGDEEYEVREEASAQLSKKGFSALAALKAALHSKDLEVQLRAKRLYSRIVVEPMLKQALTAMTINDKETAQKGFTTAIRLTLAMAAMGKEDRARANIHSTPLRFNPLFQLLRQVTSSKGILSNLDRPKIQKMVLELFLQRWNALRKKNLLLPKPVVKLAKE